VSFVRAYSKHEASYIFRIKDLDLIGVAKSFGLLRLPRMPELKDADKGGWVNDDLNWATFAYLDKAKEAKRLTEDANKLSLDEILKRQKFRLEMKLKDAAWSNKVVKREGRERRKDKKVRKRKWIAAQTVEASSKSVARNEMDDGEDDWDELAREERMAKKLKRGEISQSRFDHEFSGL